jgi:hypothetical protein
MIARLGAAGRGLGSVEVTHHRLRPTEVDEAPRSQTQSPTSTRERRSRRQRPGAESLRSDTHGHNTPLDGVTESNPFLSMWEVRPVIGIFDEGEGER